MNSIGRKSREAFEKERVEWTPPGAVITSTSFYCLNGFGSEETHTLSAVTWTRGNCVAVSWLLATPSTQRTCSCSGRSVRLLSRTSLWMVHSSFITSWTDGQINVRGGVDLDLISDVCNVSTMIVPEWIVPQRGPTWYCHKWQPSRLWLYAGLWYTWTLSGLVGSSYEEPPFF